MPNASFESIFTSTLNHHRKRLTDNVFKNNFLLDHMNRKGRIGEKSGAQIVEPIEFQKNTTVMSFGPYDTINIDNTEPLTAAVFPWKYIAATTAISDQEEVKNSGPEQVFDLVKAKVKNTEKSVGDKLNEQLFSDGQGSGGKDFYGLQWIVNDNTAAVVAMRTLGGIDSTVDAFWRATIVDASADGSTIRDDSEWANGINTASKGSNMRADIGVTTQALYEHYEASLAPMLRLTSNDEADARFQHLLFKGVKLGWDSYCLAGSTYFLNTDFLALYTMKNRWFHPTAWKDAPDKIARWQQILCYGNLATNDRSRQVWIKGQTV